MKKLVLYSDQEIPENARIDRRMLALIDKPHPLVGYIPSSADPDRKWFKIKQAYYAAIGVTLTNYFELDDHFEPDALASLIQCDAIHLSGGNTYHFLYWLRRRGMLEVLRNYVKNGGVLIGNSAGSILMVCEARGVHAANTNNATATRASFRIRNLFSRRYRARATS